MPSSPPPSPGPADGHLLAGRYRLVRAIASGGMARVWEADDVVLGRPVAVKILHAHLASDEQFVARFRAEAISAARLAHPGIVSIYDTWSNEDGEAIVMELVRGTTLRHLLDHRGPLQPDEAVTIADHIATALDVAHRAGIVHRDIKPANVLLSADGRVLVTDFGIAKATEGSDLTVERTMLGTAKYLAPEQVEGAPVDGRTDLYALGVVLYEMLCGEVPFKADTEAATALARLHRAAEPPSRRRPGLSASLEAVVLRCLARRPEDRPADATELRRLLATCDRRLGAPPAPSPVTGPPPPPAPTAPPLQAPPTAAPTTAPPTAPAVSPEHHAPAAAPRPRSRGRWLAAALVLLAVLVAGVLVAALTQRQADARPLTVTANAFDPLGHPPGEENNATAGLATDGDPATAWTTERYRDPDALGKPGVGLVVEAADSAKLTTLTIASPSTGWTAAVYVVDGDPPADLEGWGTPVGQRAAIPAGTATFDLDDRRGRSVLVWITRTGDDGRVAITEASLAGR